MNPSVINYAYPDDPDDPNACETLSALDRLCTMLGGIGFQFESTQKERIKFEETETKI